MSNSDGSGYGRNAIVPDEDARLTHVAFGTPMGELMRRYWQPVCLSSELGELPKFLRILGEEPGRLSGQVRACRRARRPLRASRHLARIRPYRGGRNSLLLPRLALRP